MLLLILQNESPRSFFSKIFQIELSNLEMEDESNSKEEKKISENFEKEFFSNNSLQLDFREYPSKIIQSFQDLPIAYQSIYLSFNSPPPELKS